MKQIDAKENQITAKVALFFIVFLSYALATSAQITIGSNIPPEKAALLDLKDKATSGDEVSASRGLLLPRVSLNDIENLTPLVSTGESNYAALKLSHKGLMVYNINVLAAQNLTQGVYIWDGKRWQKAAGYKGPQDFFYMPSVPINTTATGTKTLDLYTLYKNQFLSPKVVSTGAPASIPYYAKATDLYYYVTDYDTAVFSNVSISSSGVMTYTVIGNASAYSFINIVFVIK